MTYDRKNPEDIYNSCEQHAADAICYGPTRKRHWFAEMRVFGI